MAEINVMRGFTCKKVTMKTLFCAVFLFFLGTIMAKECKYYLHYYELSKCCTIELEHEPSTLEAQIKIEDQSLSFVIPLRIILSF